MKSKSDNTIIEEYKFSQKSNRIAFILKANAILFLMFLGFGTLFFILEYAVDEATYETAMLQLCCIIISGVIILLVILLFCYLPFMLKEIIIDENGVFVKTTANKIKILKWGEILKISLRKDFWNKKSKTNTAMNTTVIVYYGNTLKKKLGLPYQSEMIEVIEKFINIDKI